MSLPANILDATDVPRVDAADLATALAILSPGGRRVRMPRGLNQQDLSRIEGRLWSEPLNPATRTATMVRLLCLADVLQLDRFERLINCHGTAVIAPLLRAAARIRLNSRRGYNPNTLLWAVEDELQLAEVARVAWKQPVAAAA